MFVFKIKLSAKKFFCLSGILAVAAAVICVLCMVSIHSSVPDTATCDELGAYSLKAESSSDQTDFLMNFGIVANEKSKKSRYVTIPCKFNNTYEEYNRLQKKIGLDLSRYKGETALEVTYKIENIKNKYAVLLVYKSNVIGAHITNGEYGSKNMPLI